ncbi:hypothetical protein ACJX0J_013028, partial [Zea mays]
HYFCMVTAKGKKIIYTAWFQRMFMWCVCQEEPYRLFQNFKLAPIILAICTFKSLLVLLEYALKQSFFI